MIPPPPGGGPGADARDLSFWLGMAAGWVLILVGLQGLLVDRDLTKPVNLVLWILGLAVAHDLLLAPVAYALALGVARLLPRWAATPVRAGLAATALLVAYAWPLVRGYGRHPSNSSVLPLDYGRNLTGSLVVLWAGIAGWLALAGFCAHRRRSVSDV